MFTTGIAVYGISMTKDAAVPLPVPELLNPVLPTPHLKGAVRSSASATSAVLPRDSLYRLRVSLGDGSDFDLSRLAGKVTLVVNTATH